MTGIFIVAHGPLLKCPRCYAVASHLDPWTVREAKLTSEDGNAGQRASDYAKMQCASCLREFRLDLDRTQVELMPGAPVARKGELHAHLILRFGAPSEEKEDD